LEKTKGSNLGKNKGVKPILFTVLISSGARERCWFISFLNRKGVKDAKGFIYFLIGVADREKNHALRAGYLFKLFTMRFMPSFINGTFQFRRNPSLRLVSLR
jgi:hypothetical protein